jgi:type II secretory pathway component PulM
MILSRRERYIVIGTVAVVGLLALDRLFLTPMLERRQVLDAQMRQATEEMTRANGLFTNSPRVNRKWNELTAQTLKTDGSNAESQIIRAVGDWAREAGLNLSSVKPERAEAVKPERGEKDKQVTFMKITFRANATGNMAAISRFMWRLQTSKVPVRVTDLSITTLRDGVDDLSLDLGISTLYLPLEPAKGETAGKSQAPGAEDRI